MCPGSLTTAHFFELLPGAQQASDKGEGILFLTPMSLFE